MGMYSEMNTPGTNAGLARDLFAFVQEQPYMQSGFTTFIASFAEPHPFDEGDFERLLWQQLQALHDLDAPLHAWDASVSADPENPAFSFSFAGHAFFIIGMSPASSRWSRRFAWPMLVFNAHNQFEHMNVSVLPSGEIEIDPPLSRAGDYILLRAEMDMIVGLTACSAELSNNGTFKPIDVEILDE